MADFVQTMNDWRRMCQYMNNEYGACSCDRCPLTGCAAIYEDEGEMDYADVKNKVGAWAAEHPEPVYPTWWSWLINEGVIEKGSTYTGAFDQLKTKPIRVDIAQKLGIEPKEG